MPAGFGPRSFESRISALAAPRSGPTRPGLRKTEFGHPSGFLEFDRGTVHAAALRAKFGAYHRYKAGDWAARDYDGFPTILVVTTGPTGEQRTVDAVRASATGVAGRLPVLVTSVGWIESDSRGPFGPIWLDPKLGCAGAGPRLPRPTS